MKIVAITSLPAVDRPNANRWNAARSRQFAQNPISYLISTFHFCGCYDSSEPDRSQKSLMNGFEYRDFLRIEDISIHCMRNCLDIKHRLLIIRGIIETNCLPQIFSKVLVPWLCSLSEIEADTEKVASKQAVLVDIYCNFFGHYFSKQKTFAKLSSVKFSTSQIEPSSPLITALYSHPTLASIFEPLLDHLGC